MLTVSCNWSLRLASTARSDSPSTKGIEKKGRSSMAPAVSTGTMLGCCSLARKAVEIHTARELVGQHLYDDAALERGVARNEDAGHAAAIQFARDRIGGTER